MGSKFCAWLGKISFMFYLGHELIFRTISVHLMDLFYNIYKLGFMISFLLNLILSTIIIFLVGHYAEKYIDTHAIEISRYFYDICKREKSV